MTRVQFTFDYVDPGSYLASSLIAHWMEQVEAGVVVDWRPLELRTPGTRPLNPVDPHWLEMSRTIEEHAHGEGVAFSQPVAVPFTRKAHELALHAREKGCFAPVHQAVFEAHFLRGLDIGRIDVLTGIAAECGLDRAEARTTLGVDRFRDDVEAHREAALASGVRGVPTLEGGGSKLEGFDDPGSLRTFLGKLTEERWPAT